MADFFELTAAQGGVRLDVFIKHVWADETLSREKIKKIIEQGACLINGKTVLSPSYKLKKRDVVAISMVPKVPADIEPEKGLLDIVYEDEDMLVVNKPAGLTVHPAPSCHETTLVHYLLSEYPQVRSMGGERPGIVHRLDKDTSGLLCIALREESRLKLSEQFSEHSIRKEYLALVHGSPDTDEGWIDAPIGRHPAVKTKMAVVKNGKPALSRWAVLHRGRDYALVKIAIETGRTHQIRVHMAHIGCPLWGDSVYGKIDIPRKGMQPIERQMLHAWHLSLTHPIRQKRMAFICPPPRDFEKTLCMLEKRMFRIVVTGSAGCGKSTVLKRLREKGLAIWSADEAVKKLYEYGQDGWTVLRQRFGDRFAPHGAAVDRQRLAAALCDDNQEDRVDVRELNTLLHPLVFADLEQFWQQREAEGDELSVAEVPLWFEASSLLREKIHADIVAGIFCQDAIRRNRLLSIRGWSLEMLHMAESAQWSQEKKMHRCQYVIDNSGTAEELTQKTDLFLDYITDCIQNGEKIFLQQMRELFSKK
ncbi:MAG: dephospho-CoA kinase [Desulfovibrionaceae bacterium]|nr:dephospho-CoA kinase [Desulfovibrionaceae bacterium]